MMKQPERGTPALVLLVATLVLSGAPAAGWATPAQAVEGAWRAETYELADGIVHAVDGMIFFTGSDWQVVFFVLDDAGAARRGSGEGGTYTLDDDRLTFRHRYNLSAGEAMEGLPASALRLEIRAATGEAVEPCTIEVAGRRLTIHFPSGNRMVFSRSS